MNTDIQGLLTIYRTESVEEIDNLNELLSDLSESTETKVELTTEPAVLGELGGIALTILLSNPVQAITAAKDIGEILHRIVGVARNAGRKIFVRGEVATHALSAAASGIEQSSRTFGPMEIDLEGDQSLSDWVYESSLPELGPSATLTAFERENATEPLTYWALLTSGADSVTWITASTLEMTESSDIEGDLQMLGPHRVVRLGKPFSEWAPGDNCTVFSGIKVRDDENWSTRWILTDRGRHISSWRT